VDAQDSRVLPPSTCSCTQGIVASVPTMRVPLWGRPSRVIKQLSARDMAESGRVSFLLILRAPNADRITEPGDGREQSDDVRGSTGCMPTMENTLTRQLGGFLTLLIVLFAQAAPLAACARSCPIKPLATMPCCATEAPSREASLSAGSCCHFEAATPRTQSPGIFPPLQRSQEVASLLAILTPSTAPPSPALERSGSELPQPRSTDSPITLHNTLRL
jgi:hypothetical protein